MVKVKLVEVFSAACKQSSSWFSCFPYKLLMSLYHHILIVLTHSFTAELTMDNQPDWAARFMLGLTLSIQVDHQPTAQLQKRLEGQFEGLNDDRNLCSSLTLLVVRRRVEEEVWCFMFFFIFRLKPTVNWCLNMYCVFHCLMSLLPLSFIEDTSVRHTVTVTLAVMFPHTFNVSPCWVYLVVSILLLLSPAHLRAQAGNHSSHVTCWTESHWHRGLKQVSPNSFQSWICVCLVVMSC